MRVMGLDPGSRSAGWGVVVRENGRYRALAAGAIHTAPPTPMPERLLALFRGYQEILREWSPDCVAIEAIFSHRSATSALTLGQARGVALLAVAEAGVPLYEYNASTIKNSVGGSGKADKEQVKRMVGMLLGGALAGPSDVSDAVAIAITHHASSGFRLPPKALGIRP